MADLNLAPTRLALAATIANQQRTIAQCFSDRGLTVKDYGAKGDGVTDDTAAINSAITAVSTSGSSRIVYFPEGTYKISSAINPAVAQLTFRGDHRTNTVISQTTANTPVFQWTSDLSGGAHSITFEHLKLTNANAPTTSTTQQYGIQFRADPTGTVASGNGFYICRFVNLNITNQYVGIGQYTTTGGCCPMWSNVYRDIVFSQIAHNAIKINNTISIGQPNNVIENVNVLNGGSNGFTPDGYAVDVNGPTGLLINGLNVEDWYNNLLSIQGGYSITINNLRTERFNITSNTYPRICYFATGNFVLNDFYFDANIANTAGFASLIFADANAAVSVNGWWTSYNPSSTTFNPVAMVWGDGITGTVETNNAYAATAFNLSLDSGFGTGRNSWTFHNRIPVAKVLSASTTLNPVIHNTLLCNAASGAITLTLPTAAVKQSYSFLIKKTDSSANAVTVTTTSAQTIDASTTYVLSSQYKYVSVISNELNWIVVGNN